MKSDKKKNKKSKEVVNENTYVFTKESLKFIIDNSIGECQNADLLTDRTKELIAWIRCNTFVASMRNNRRLEEEGRHNQIGFR